MTMTDEPQTEAPKPAKKRVVKKRKVARAAPAAKAEPKSANPFAGISPSECCDSCNESKCAISGINVCAHPMKGGLQSAQMRDPEALKRFNRAKAALKDQMIDLRGR